MGRPKSSKSSSSQHYIDAAEFTEELRECQQKQQLSERMYRFFQKLAHKCSGSFVYTSNEDRQDCIATAVSIMATKYMKYDFNHESGSNAFSYFTSVAFNGLRAGWNELNGHNSRTYRIDQIFKED